MFQNVFMTVTPLSEINDEIKCWENRPFIHTWPESYQQKKIKKDAVTRTIKKKNKRHRTAYTTDQLRVLEKTFSRTKYVDVEHRKQLAENLKIGEKCIKVWFQNRRMKEKKECSEAASIGSSSDYIVHEPVTPPSENPIQYGNGDQTNVQPSNSYIDQTIHGSNTTEAHSYYYPYKEDCEAVHQSYAVSYQNYVDADYASYSMPPHPNQLSNYNSYFHNEANVYPSQYYPCTSAVPEYVYTNMDNRNQ